MLVTSTQSIVHLRVKRMAGKWELLCGDDRRFVRDVLLRCVVRYEGRINHILELEKPAEVAHLGEEVVLWLGTPHSVLDAVRARHIVDLHPDGVRDFWTGLLSC